MTPDMVDSAFHTIDQTHREDRGEKFLPPILAEGRRAVFAMLLFGDKNPVSIVRWHGFIRAMGGHGHCTPMIAQAGRELLKEAVGKENTASALRAESADRVRNNEAWGE